MVSQRDLNKVVEQINSSYAALIKRLDKLEAANVALNTKSKESKDK